MRLFLLMLLLSVSSWADSIDDLVGRLQKSHGLWVNGLFPTLDLPVNASNEELLHRLDKTGRVLSSREISIDGQGPYRALRVITGDGPRILLLRYEGKTGWWSRFYSED